MIPDESIKDDLNVDLAETGNFPADVPQDDLRQTPGSSWWGEPAGEPVIPAGAMRDDADIPAVEGEGL